MNILTGIINILRPQDKPSLADVSSVLTLERNQTVDNHYYSTASRRNFGFRGGLETQGIGNPGNIVRGHIDQ